ncbi:hypothetical protein LILAB_03940 [Corallococcus macrosporus]|uniref:Uncharacterized protein n=1 Tax=Myxococcus fulvus (strain ATCC BAA-855 / HW-1) TaxID=483219 RepID=F8CKP8_MYXFH|nr:hypothetical protein LILAB_03940 [Corallococcus macrosporus]
MVVDGDWQVLHGTLVDALEDFLDPFTDDEHAAGVFHEVRNLHSLVALSHVDTSIGWIVRAKRFAMAKLIADESKAFREVVDETVLQVFAGDE